MTIPLTGAEEARKRLPDILDAAEQGKSTVITRRGRPVATVMPVSLGVASLQQPLLPLSGTGHGLWEQDSARTIDRLRDEWDR